ncbi:MAG: DMT family transporter, partial [Chitinophagaceae bacterium]
SPFAIKRFKQEWPVVKKSGLYLVAAALTGVALFNTFVYIAAHYTTAINLALIGTTSSPIFAVILSAIFLKEKIGPLKMTGMILCIAGVVYLLCKGDFQNLLALRFTAGDGWALLAAFTFAIYSPLVRKKPTGISSINFLFVTFWTGVLLLLPAFLIGVFNGASIQWTPDLFLIILYLGVGTSVISFLCWNKAIGHLGSGRTALFGNLIPVFSSIEAAIILHEKFTTVHVISMLAVFTGIVVVNLEKKE